MSDRKTDIQCDLMIIGTGMAGMAAGLFAAGQGIKAVLAGVVGQLSFASGLIDVLGVHPVAQGCVVENPWAGIERLCKDAPDHPYARLTTPSIQEAIHTVLKFMEAGSYPYVAHAGRNMTVITPAGTVKPTYAVPHTMAAGPAAMAENKAALIVDFKGLRGFSSRQIAQGLAERWPALRGVQVDFPGASAGELYAERMARSLEVHENRARLVDAVLPHISDAAAVGFPAILGISRTLEVMKDLEQGLGVPVFEIPTMPPSVAGMRLLEIFEQQLPARGIDAFFHHTVKLAGRSADGRWRFEIACGTQSRHVSARAALLCSGRFFGKGLYAGRKGIRETLFGLPVAQPMDRSSWHHKDLLYADGHPVNRAGLAVDEGFRPVDGQGRLCYPNLFAAGAILAHQDWMRQKCGSGLAIATAQGAVDAFVAADDFH